MRTIITITAAVVIGGCAATPSLDPPARARPSTQSIETQFSEPGSQVARHALAMVGTPYRYGGSTPDTGFDCSGLVYYSFDQIGVRVPRTSLEQFRAARKISLRDARDGDILFFEDQEKLSHVGIYVGDQRFVHAPTSGRTVSVASLENSYYQMHLVGVGRLLR